MNCLSATFFFFAFCFLPYPPPILVKRTPRGNSGNRCARTREDRRSFDRHVTRIELERTWIFRFSINATYYFKHSFATSFNTIYLLGECWENLCTYVRTFAKAIRSLLNINVEFLMPVFRIKSHVFDAVVMCAFQDFHAFFWWWRRHLSIELLSSIDIEAYVTAARRLVQRPNHYFLNFLSVKVSFVCRSSKFNLYTQVVLIELDEQKLVLTLYCDINISNKEFQA